VCGVIAGIFQLILAPILEPDVRGYRVRSGDHRRWSIGCRLRRACCVRDDVSRSIHLHLFSSARQAKYLIFGLIVFGVLSVGGRGRSPIWLTSAERPRGMRMLILARRFPSRNSSSRSGWLLSKERNKARESKHEDVVEAKVYDIAESVRRLSKELYQIKSMRFLTKYWPRWLSKLTEDEKRSFSKRSQETELNRLKAG